MIDIYKGDALIDGGCCECPACEDRETEILVFRVGGFRVRLCRDHARELERSLESYRQRNP